ncbi:hypothetical protein [Sorangium sp. So ce590]|uniref:hypothetical protein n=1 Tax=unclassified Sorangium TaxID=2621164 RepID=UPI003F61CE72
MHRAEVIEIEAESYRLKEVEELSATRSKQRRTNEALSGLFTQLVSGGISDAPNPRQGRPAAALAFQAS